jgi:hypothetical protein
VGDSPSDSDFPEVKTEMAMGIAASASSCCNVAPCRSAFLRFLVDQRELLSIGSSNSTIRRRARRGAGVMPVLSAFPSDAMQVALQSIPDPNPDLVTWQVVVGAAGRACLFFSRPFPTPDFFLSSS